ncbi:hypothetical protein [Polymorphospora sp. NPDC050346]|uniref:hypothetical protein n=1 Tax=Polymorphospora sp. NPDC050346 TaxID=3155780 RepID=UPI00340F78F2
MAPTTIADRFDALQDAAANAKAGTLSPTDTAAALIAAADLVKALDLRAYPADDHDDTLEQVVVTVHGVDLSIRGRRHDLFVHIEDNRDNDERRQLPLTIEVNNGGEMTYGEHADDEPTGPALCDQCDDRPATDLELQLCAWCADYNERRGG